MAIANDTKKKLVTEFGINPNDTGSMEIQIALLTEDIRDLTGHCQKFPKDNSCKRGLLKKVCQRRRFLEYLEKNNGASYKNMIGRLGLKK